MLGIAPVLHEDAAQRPLGGSFAVVEDKPERQIVERAGPGEIGDEVGPNEGCQVFDRSEAPGQELYVDRRDNRQHCDRERGDRAQEAARRYSGSRHHDEFAVAVELVERVENAGKQRDRRNDRDQGRQRKPGHQDKDENRLTLAGQEIDLTQSLGDPNNASQHDEPVRKAVAAVLRT